MNSIEQIAPCPFCGGEAVAPTHDDEFEAWRCGCSACNAHTWADTEDEAIAAWNRRTASEQPASGEAAPAPGFQSEVADWMLTCFGEEIAADRIERADRFIEEALELAQTIPGFTVERARALVEYVFNRPVGERGQEVGGVGVTLAALCNTYDLNIREEWERELARVWTKVDAIRAKQASKPVGSALPIALSTTSEAPRGVNCPDCGGRIATACPHCGAEPMTDADIATLTPSALSGEPVQKLHELPRDVGARAIELLREYYDAEEIDDVDARSSELGACRFSVRAFLETVPSALTGDAGEGE